MPRTNVTAGSVIPVLRPGLRTIRRATFAALLVALLITSSSDAAAGRYVLLLQSLDRGNLTLDQFTGDFRVELDRLAGEPVTVAQFVTTPSGFGVSPEASILAFLRSAFVNRSAPGVVVTAGGPAAAFARKYRQQLFPESPTLFAAVDQRFLQDAPLADNEAAVSVVNDISGIVDDIVNLFPQTSNLFMVVGSGPLGRFWHQQLDRDFQRFGGRVTFTWSDEMTLAQILQHVSTLPRDSAILYLHFDADPQGGQFPEDRVLADIHAAANAPLFGAQGAFLGRGVVGGNMLFIDGLGRAAASAALRILNGEPPRSVQTPVVTTGPPTFDWRELQRWGVPESRLPPGSVIRFREPGVWQRFKWIIIAASSALIAQAVLIGALLLNRTRRRRAEHLLRDNVANLEAARRGLVNLSGRLIDAHEQERTRLARELHDDVSQRMSSLAMDVGRLRQTLPAEATGAHAQVVTLLDAVVAVGRDIQGISHRLHSSKIGYLGLAAAAGSFCRETASRHNLNIEYTHENVPTDLPEGVAISLFRVLQEALSNAVKHSGANRCTVTLRAIDGELRLEVIDDGHGFGVDAALKGQGLGLVSMQERLKLVKGSVVIESKPGGGTVVRARVPVQPPAETTL